MVSSSPALNPINQPDFYWVTIANITIQGLEKIRVWSLLVPSLNQFQIAKQIDKSYFKIFIRIYSNQILKPKFLFGSKFQTICIVQ